MLLFIVPRSPLHATHTTFTTMAFVSFQYAAQRHRSWCHRRKVNDRGGMADAVACYSQNALAQSFMSSRVCAVLINAAWSRRGRACRQWPHVRTCDVDTGASEVVNATSALQGGRVFLMNASLEPGRVPMGPITHIS